MGRVFVNQVKKLSHEIELSVVLSAWLIKWCKLSRRRMHSRKKTNKKIALLYLMHLSKYWYALICNNMMHISCYVHFDFPLEMDLCARRGFCVYPSANRSVYLMQIYIQFCDVDVAPKDQEVLSSLSFARSRSKQKQNAAYTRSISNFISAYVYMRESAALNLVNKFIAAGRRISL